MMNPERRHQPRTRLDQISPVLIEPDNGGIIIDLSEGGLSFQAVAPVHHMDQLRIRFSSRQKGHINAYGELMWTDETKTRGGLKFLQLSEEGRQFIQEVLTPPDRPVEQDQDSTPAATATTETKDKFKFTALMADQLRSSGGDDRSIPPVPVTDTSPLRPSSSRQSDVANFLHYDESVPSQRTPAVLPRTLSYEGHEPQLSISGPQESSTHEGRQHYRRGLLTGIAVSALVAIGVFVFITYRGQIGDSLIHDVRQPSPGRETQTPHVIEPPAISTPNASATSPAGQPAGALGAHDESGLQAAQSNATGQYELNMAERLLSGSNVPPNGRTPAQWLWAAVEQGNVTAEVVLSDLYATGNGVGKNCEQARVLLQAAANKGNPEAAAKLRNVDQNGCP